MARRPETDERQEDIFGAPAPAPRPAKPVPAATSRATTSRTSPAADPDGEAPYRRAADRRPDLRRMSRMELEELLRDVPDDVLVQLTGAVTRQLRRRIARAGYGRGPGKARAPALERMAQQLADEMSGLGGDDYE